MTFAEYGVDEVRFHPGWRSLVDSASASAPVSAVFPGKHRHEGEGASSAAGLLRGKFHQDLEWQQKPSTVFLAREMMRSPVVSIRSDATLAEAQSLMESHGIGHLPVRNENQSPIGMISQNDIYRLVMKSPRTREWEIADKIANHMATPLLACHPDADVREIARVFLLRRIGSLIVVHESAILGILTRTDLLRSLMAHPSLQWRA
jgi:acetoin utilization protein AcuB